MEKGEKIEDKMLEEGGWCGKSRKLQRRKGEQKGNKTKKAKRFLTFHKKDTLCASFLERAVNKSVQRTVFLFLAAVKIS